MLSDSRAGEGAPQKIDHALIGGVVAVVMFAILCVLIGLGRYFARHKGNAAASAITLEHDQVAFFPPVFGHQSKRNMQLFVFLVISNLFVSSPTPTPCCPPGTYFTHEAKGADDAADADTAIINAEGGHNNTDEKKEYYI